VVYLKLLSEQVTIVLEGSSDGTKGLLSVFFILCIHTVLIVLPRGNFVSILCLASRKKAETFLRSIWWYNKLTITQRVEWSRVFENMTYVNLSNKITHQKGCPFSKLTKTLPDHTWTRLLWSPFLTVPQFWFHSCLLSVWPICRKNPTNSV
jgi:hypothetical protein